MELPPPDLLDKTRYKKSSKWPTLILTLHSKMLICKTKEKHSSCFDIDDVSMALLVFVPSQSVHHLSQLIQLNCV